MIEDWPGNAFIQQLRWCALWGSVMSCLLRRTAASAAVSRLVVVLSAIGLALPLAHCSKGYDFFASDPESRELSPSRTVGGTAGGTVTLYGSPESAGPRRSENIRAFVRSGVLADFSNQESASFQNFGGGSANGNVAVSHSWTVPALAGVSIPASRIGVPVRGLTAEVYGGVQVTHRKASLYLTEAFAPGGPATSGSTSWTSIDPAIGAALMYEVGNLDNRPVTVGPSVTVDWAPSHSLAVTSANFPATETYTFNTGRQTETRVMLNVNVGVNSMVSAGAAAGFTR
jgi:hypothetical protein